MRTSTLQLKPLLLISLLQLTSVLLGQVPQLAWAESIGGGGVSDASVLTIDRWGNSYMAGTFSASGITLGSVFLNGSGSTENGFVAKFDSQGNTLWAKRVRRVGGFQDSTNPDRIAIDDSGNVYLCGVYLDGALIDLTVLPGDFGFFVAKFDEAGNFQWARTTQSPDGFQPYNSIHVNNQQEVCMTGLYNSTIQFSADQILTNPNPNGIAGFIVKYDGDGNVVNAVDLGVSNFDFEPWAPYPTEYFRYDLSDHIYRFVEATRTLMKYDGNGVLLTSQTFNVGETISFVDMAISAQEEVYLAGNFIATLQFENVEITVPNPSGWDFRGFVVKINDDGLAQLMYSTPTGSAHQIRKIETDSIENLYVLGAVGTLGLLHVSVTKLNSSGSLLWQEQIFPTDITNNIVGDIAPRNLVQAQNGGNVFITGTYRNFIRFNESVNFSTTGNVWRIFLAQYGLCDMAKPEIITADSALCPGESVQISPTTEGHFLWSTGDTTTILEANVAGDYFAFAVDSLGCYAASNIVSITEHPVPEPPSIEASSLSFCAGSGVTIASNENENNIWSTGEVGDSIFVSSTGFYFVQTVNEFGCSSMSDVILISENPLPNNAIALTGITLSAQEENSSYQWINCDENNAQIEGAIFQSFMPLQNGSYAVQVTNNFGCTVTSECLPVVVTSTEPLNTTSAWSIYPNPAHEYFIVNSGFDPVQTTVLTIDGKVVFNSNSRHIDIEHLASGIYFVNIQSDKEQKMVRLAVE